MERSSFKERFIADSMLGRLAKWLRIIGYDTAYYNNIEDDLLIEKSLSEGRWLITRDTLLIRRLIKGFTFIKDNDPMDQLRQIVTELNLKIHNDLLTRCLECNTRLIRAYRDEVIGTVPEYIYSTNREFYFCPSCNRVYWRGSHIDRVKESLKKIFPGEVEKE